METLAESKLRESVYSLGAMEYAKIEAIKSKIAGLRMGMVASAIIGGALSSAVFVSGSLSGEVSGLFGMPSGNPASAAVAVAVPFVLLCVVLSYRVNKHTERLSRGKFDRRRLIE